MDGNGLGGGLFSPMGSGLIGLEMPIQQNPQSSQNKNPHHLPHHQMPAYPGGYSFGGSAKQKHVAVSDDDDDGDGKRKVSPWQRMKWTDTMVRLLITAVFYIGDEGGVGGAVAVAEGTDGKKKPVSGTSGGLLQKKGKWKSVSKAMLEKGFYVSPQQCEDKFNDLNKRYKRVNDILGKGTACRVVENQGLLDSMELAPKTKEEVKKLLNSKHLFFREMCAYHNSCGHGGAGPQPQHPQPAVEKQQCSQSTGDNARAVSKGDDNGGKEDNNDSEDSDSDDDMEDDEEESCERPCSRKRGSSETVERFGGDVAGVVGDGGRTWREKREWLRERAVELEEEEVRCREEALELEKRRLKWAKFSGKKERELEKAKIENEKRRIENERMILMVRQREIEISNYHHQPQHSNKRSDPSSITG